MGFSTVFVARVTHIVADWLNAINTVAYEALGAAGEAPTTPTEVITNLGLTAQSAPSGASLIGLDFGAGTTVQAFVDAIQDPGGAAVIGFAPAGDLAATNVQDALEELDTEKASLHKAQAWTAGAQALEYTFDNTASGDQGGWVAVVRRDSGSSNAVPLVGHAHHDGAYSTGAGCWGVVTEAWSNPDGQCTLIGGEVAVISQAPDNLEVSVGLNSVFKNRSDIQTNPTAPVGDGSLYNKNSWAVFISSQLRPSGAGAAWSGVGSGWQAAFKIGIANGGSGLDWEGGSFFPGSSVHKAYSVIMDATEARTDLAGGWPWIHLIRYQTTYWGTRFNGTLTGCLTTYNLKVNAGGAGYAVADTGNITGGGGSGATYYVKAVSAGVVTEVAIILGGLGYAVTSGAATTITTGAGSGLTVDITLGVGLFYGQRLGIPAGGSGYAVNDLVNLNGGTAGYVKPILKVTAVSAGVVTAVQLMTYEFNGANTPNLQPNGRGFVVAGAKTTTAITGAGTGLEISITDVYNDLTIGGEKWEYWRMLNPSCPISSGIRTGFVDASFPGAAVAIDTSAATYTFPLDSKFS